MPLPCSGTTTYGRGRSDLWWTYESRESLGIRLELHAGRGTAASISGTHVMRRPAQTVRPPYLTPQSVRDLA